MVGIEIGSDCQKLPRFATGKEAEQVALARTGVAEDDQIGMLLKLGEPSPSLPRLDRRVRGNDPYQAIRHREYAMPRDGNAVSAPVPTCIASPNPADQPAPSHSTRVIDRRSDSASMPRRIFEFFTGPSTCSSANDCPFQS